MTLFLLLTITPVARPAPFAALSTRGDVGVGRNFLVTEFVITGTSPKEILITALGPSLGVPGALDDPRIELRNVAGETIATNDFWKEQGDPNKVARIQNSGLAPNNDREAAVLETLAPGSYTCVVRGAGDTAGVGLSHVVQLDGRTDSQIPAIGSLVNLEGTSGAPAVVSGVGLTETRSVVVRVLGPSLGQGTGAVADPHLIGLTDANGNTVAGSASDNWRTQGGSSGTGLEPANDLESAVLIENLPAGNYTATVSGKSADGLVFLQFYALPYNAPLTAAPEADAGSCAVAPSGLAAWYAGEGDARDVRGGSSGVFRGNASANGTGKVGLAFKMDGDTDSVEVPDQQQLKPARLTVAFWVKFDSLDSTRVGSAPPGHQYLVTKHNARQLGSGLEEAYVIAKVRNDSVDKFLFTLTSASGARTGVVSQTTIQPGQYYHVAGTYDGQAMRLYVNGVLEGSTPSNLVLDYSSAPLFLGSSGIPQFNGYFNGILDEVQIFNRALSQADVGAIANAGSAGVCQQVPIVKTATFNGHTYHLLGGPISWAAAEAAAVRLGGHLVTINDAAENAFVLNTFGPLASEGGGKVSLWIGLSDHEKEGRFVWASRQPVGYTNWAAGQPEGTAGADQDFVGMFANFDDRGRWHDIVSDDRLGDVTYGVVEIGPKAIWSAARDLLANERPNHPDETKSTNTRVPQWSYGFRSVVASSAITLYPPELHVSDPKGGYEGFYGPNAGVCVVNASDRSIIDNFGSGDLRPNRPEQMLLHPADNGNMPVMRWTAPADGDYRIGAKWFDLDPYGGNGASAHLVINGVERFNAAWDNGGKAKLVATTYTLKANDVVDFVVSARGDAQFDSTSFNCVIGAVPTVTINAPAAVNVGEDIAVTVDVTHPFLPIRQVELLNNEKPILGADTTPPYQFTIPKAAQQILKLEAVATDESGAQGKSAATFVTVGKSTTAKFKTAVAEKFAARAPATADSDQCFFCFFAAFDFIFTAEVGDWNDPANWQARDADRQGRLPNIVDHVLIGDSVVTVNGSVPVGTVYLFNGKILGGEGSPELQVRRSLTMSPGLLADINLYLFYGSEFNARAEDMLMDNVFIENRGNLRVSGVGPTGTNATRILNQSTITIAPSPVSAEGPILAVADFKQQPGAKTNIFDGALKAPPGVISGVTQFGLPAGVEPPKLISESGSTLVAAGGLNLVAAGGLNLIGTDGSTLIGTDGSTLIGTDGSTLIGTDGSTALAPDAAASQLKSALSSVAALRRASEAPPGEAATSVAPEATDSRAFVLESGGVISGNGEIVGSLINRGGFISPGNSAGGLLVRGDYTQEAEGTLLLEIGGTDIAPLEYDIFQATGTANLGGKLIVNAIEQYTSVAGETVSPLLYASKTGSFASVSSNAEVAFNSTGMATQVSGPNPPAPKPLNISTRMRVEAGDNALIAGFIITGNAPKKVLVRGIGPSLPVSGALADPILSLDNGAVTNDNWQSTQEQEIRDTTIPPASDLESAIVATLNPGPHTAVLRGKNEGTGVGLVEVYDLESGTPVQLANISTRGQVQAGDNVMIGGFIIGGDYPAKVLLRAIGPSLPVAGKLDDPTLELVDANGGRITNDDWRATQESEIIATTVPPTNDKEAAIVATLVPGFYTAIVRGVDDTVGVALVEGYNLQ